MREQVVFGIFVAVLGLSPMVARAATVPELIDACQRGSENACRRLEALQSRSQNQNRGVSNDQKDTQAVPSIREIIQSDPDLRRWNQDPLAWAVAQAVDTELALKPEYAGRPFSERQAEVVRMTRLRLGETNGRGKTTLPRPAPNAESEAALRGGSSVPLSNAQYAAAYSGIRIFGSIAIGWLVFCMMTKQKNPFKKPEELHKRPKWLLALGTGLMLGGILSSPTIGIAKEDLLGALVIKAVFFVLSMIPVVIGFLVYKSRVGNAMKNATTSFDPQIRDSK